MKTPEELNALKEEPEALNKKPAELTDDELEQAAGGQYEPPTYILRSRANTFANLLHDFTPLITDIRNQKDLFDEFYDKMMDIANTQLILYPNAEYWFTFAIYKDGDDLSFPYVYAPGTLTVGRRSS